MLTSCVTTSNDGGFTRQVNPLRLTFDFGRHQGEESRCLRRSHFQRFRGHVYDGIMNCLEDRTQNIADGTESTDRTGPEDGREYIPVCLPITDLCACQQSFVGTVSKTFLGFGCANGL